MEKWKLILLGLITSFACEHLQAEENTLFKPSGKIIVKGFFDYSSRLDKNNSESGLDITRAFLGYNYRFTKSLQAQLVVDGASGRNEKGQLEPHLRNAYVSWEDNGFSISGGLIGLKQFKTQEKYWMHRYVLKSAQDLNKMGASADAGVTASYSFSNAISVDATLVNGEGYKQIEKNNSTSYGLGLSVLPIKNVLLRVYADIYNQSDSLRDALPNGVSKAQYKDQYTLALFAGYSNKSVSAGVEYNHRFNKGFIKDKNYNVSSIYASIKIAPKWNLYGRYDLTQSSAPASFTSSWNKLDGQLMIVGTEFSANKHVKISPNFRNINLDNCKSEQYLFINVEFKL